MRRIGNPPGNVSVSPVVPDIPAVPLWVGLWPRGTAAGRVVAGIVAVAVLVAACGANVGESAAVTDDAATMNSWPSRGSAPAVELASVAPPDVPPQPDPPPPPVAEPDPPPVAEPDPPPVTEPEVASPPVTEPDPPPVTEPEVASPPVTGPDTPLPPDTQPDPPPPPAPQPPPPPPPGEPPSWQPLNILVARDDVNGVIPVYDAPGGTRLSFRDGELWSYTFRGNRLVVRVTQGSRGDEWVQAELPMRPSGIRGWIRTENFNWTTVNHHITVDVSQRSVALYEGDELVISTRAIVGKPATPTPRLRGYIVEKLPNHSQQNASVVLGDWVLMLSFFSEVHDSFGGGLPRIALHGTHIPERVGEALSNGCIRIPNNIIETIARRAPLGTAVSVVA